MILHIPVNVTADSGIVTDVSDALCKRGDIFSKIYSIQAPARPPEAPSKVMHVLMHDPAVRRGCFSVSVKRPQSPVTLNRNTQSGKPWRADCTYPQEKVA